MFFSFNRQYYFENGWFIIIVLPEMENLIVMYGKEGLLHPSDLKAIPN
jgi:hypothetical protein